MRGLVVDYVGVLDGSEEDQRRWRNFFSALRKKGAPIAILSNDPGGPGADEIREWEFRGIVDAVLLSGEIGAEKPTVEAFQFAADTLELDRKDLVMVDDSIVNVRGAVEAGLIGVYYQQFDRAIVEIAGVFEIEGEF
ncbi:dUMP phosphatase [Corynebacterium ciconiae DSM 44920]|uniref:HAD family hydrolase n=1 Tax=Corynebacterium ciconiae TaxID=227319 RepID=UPI00037E5E5F|nr:HAD-IA family hydrolase [Corynebacterium ciconiae]WKD61798.1 dUMP phosphatase [Corynebacterium ciconiae DSM 44920]